ncbi:surface lipoprotein assembly modifier [Aliiruegeria haliotis]|nr:surface lipoprotein assembly modifier [Aliiruegeria haliotis]
MLTDALIARDPGDVEALVLKSRALRDMGRFDEATDIAREAYGKAETDQEIFAAAMVRAQALASNGARTRAQLWLRMAGQHAPNEQARAQAVRDFRYVRSRNKWSTSLSFSVAPSSNVNDGSTHDRISFGGLQGVVLSGAARALSGLEFSAGATTGYRFSEGKNHSTEVGLHLYHETYILSDEAKEIAPDAKGSDFAYSSVAVGLRHQFRLDDWNTPMELSVLTGRGWYGGEDYSRYTRTSVAKAFLLGKGNILRVSAGGETFNRVWDDASSHTLHTNAIWLREFDNGAGLRLSLGVRDTRSDLDSLDYLRKIGGFGYTLPKPVGPALATLMLDFEEKTYEEYPFEVDGREDLRATAGVRFLFERMDYYGFVPTVTISHAENRSTSDRYDTVETGVKVGFLSAF